MSIQAGVLIPSPVSMDDIPALFQKIGYEHVIVTAGSYAAAEVLVDYTSSSPMSWDVFDDPEIVGEVAPTPMPDGSLFLSVPSDRKSIEASRQIALLTGGMYRENDADDWVSPKG